MHRPKTTRQIARYSCTLLLISALCACGAGGGDVTGPTPHPADQKTHFDEVLYPGLEVDDAATGAPDPANCRGAGCEADFAGNVDQDGDGVADAGTVTACPLDLGTPLGVDLSCSRLCGQAATCGGLSTASKSACEVDCEASLQGTEVEAVDAVFGCFAQATCDEFERWTSGVSAATTAEPQTPDALPGNDAAIAPETIDQCIDRLVTTWSDLPLPAAKQALCDARDEADATCGSTEAAAAMSCQVTSHILSLETLQARASCDALECSDRDVCATEIRWCTPLLTIIESLHQPTRPRRP